jgi:predicted SAM-dependent methyltransferase
VIDFLHRYVILNKNLPGWCNVDLVGSRPDCHSDIRRLLPLSRGSAEAVFFEHVVERVTLAATRYAEPARR